MIPSARLYGWNRVTRVTRVTSMNRMTKVRYLLSYFDWVSHQDFKNVRCFRHFVCVFVFVILFVFVFESSYDFWIAFIISFQNMYGYRGLWSLQAEMLTIFEVMNSTYRLCRMGRVKIRVPVVLPGILWYKTKIIQDILINLELNLITLFQLIVDNRVKPINRD